MPGSVEKVRQKDVINWQDSEAGTLDSKGWFAVLWTFIPYFAMRGYINGVHREKRRDGLATQSLHGH